LVVGGRRPCHRGEQEGVGIGVLSNLVVVVVVEGEGEGKGKEGLMLLFQLVVEALCDLPFYLPRP